ncbi:radical SAM family heme chaperone HemW [Buchnera aphidicola (Thelaxes californica)]|uniref:Heme chaperone HemW n=1 Tax=Buchnera aphidicola (Thelaxes californica) TaxID=1315998 RepID=A0A4D6YLN5_9GAMM|nr:radical SAM family heme chaperone HemW [Buchnera aphidicola]QCI26950.1 radical SAM family heme chaperone HemW [Buchnera aphidicola (Thelaxes californica)]
MIPISLYIHIPWCIKKCPYCDFNSYTTKTKIDEIEYINFLIQDLEQDLHLINHRKIQNIFIGGGTPSLFNIESIHYLIQKIKKKVHLSKSTEITIEANPTNIEYKKIIEYNKIGINRISLGVQTFNNVHLKNLGRLYTEQDIKNVIHNMKSNQKNINFNIDIMHSLHNQSYFEAIEDLNKAISYNPNHISWYQLTIEPNTLFFYQKLNLTKDLETEKIIKQGNKILEKYGYIQYEISSYCKAGYQCKHNLNYWKFGDYIGIGCGAHGKITQKNKKIIRTVKFKNIHDYIKYNFLKKKYQISHKDIALEFFMNICRLKKKINKKDLYKKTGLKQQEINNQIKKCIQEGYIKNDYKYWEITKKGYQFLNSLLEIFVV